MTDVTTAMPAFEPPKRFNPGDLVLIIPTGQVGQVIAAVGARHWALEVGGELLLEEDGDLSPAPTTPPAPGFGLSSTDLAQYVSEAITRATSRVLGVGQEQYDQGDSQKFETMPLGDLVEGALEELDDVIVYSVMTQIRFRRWWDELNRRGAS